MQANYKISYRDKPTPPRYADLEKLITPIAKDIAFRWSHKGVPHLLVELGRGIVYSLCYFKGHNSWRVFFPYGSGNQQKQDFTSVEDLMKFLKRHQPKQCKETR